MKNESKKGKRPRLKKATELPVHSLPVEVRIKNKLKELREYGFSKWDAICLDVQLNTINL